MVTFVIAYNQILSYILSSNIYPHNISSPLMQSLYILSLLEGTRTSALVGEEREVGGGEGGQGGPQGCREQDREKHKVSGNAAEYPQTCNHVR